jgi:tRNA threonylcarbamoyladenosine modification (KEOPS) complex  Pcc1 subunit
MITATITLPKKAPLLQLMKTEQESFRHKRASYTIEKNIVTITAEDGSALKATVASICRVVTIFEKAVMVRA